MEKDIHTHTHESTTGETTKPKKIGLRVYTKMKLENNGKRHTYTYMYMKKIKCAVPKEKYIHVHILAHY